MNTPHILIVEDDRDIGQLVAKYLKSNEMRVSLAENGRAMDRILGDTRISLIVLDRMLPGEDGLSICRRLRAASDIPIIILTAQADEIERSLRLIALDAERREMYSAARLGRQNQELIRDLVYEIDLQESQLFSRRPTAS